MFKDAAAPVCRFLHPFPLISSVTGPTMWHFSHRSAWKTTPPQSPAPHSQCCTLCPWTVIASLWRRHQSQADESVQPSVFLSDTRRRRTHSLFSAFISCVLGVKCDISPHITSPRRPSLNPPLSPPFVSSCIFLYEISVLIGEIVVYGQALEFQQIMEGILCSDRGQKIIGLAWTGCKMIGSIYEKLALLASVSK